MGAAYAIVDDKEVPKNEKVILVEDVLITLQELAKFHRNHFSIPFIGITGSNGKTTTKELLAAVLSKKYKTFATRGNLNNHIGVPLSLLEIKEDVEMAVIEMGANHLDEIAFLCTIAQPNYGLITNVGKAHLEGFGSFENIKTAKSELYASLASNQGTLFLQSDNPYLPEMAKKYTFKEVIPYGFKRDNFVSGKVLNQDPYLTIEWHHEHKTHQVKTQITGSYNLENLLAAAAVGSYFQIPAPTINHAFSSYLPVNNRSQILETRKNTVLCDFYNANSSSMEAALENFTNLHGKKKKVVILGDMFEMGEKSKAEHERVLAKALLTRSSACIFIGPIFKSVKMEKPGLYFFNSTREAIRALTEKPLQDCLILLKASRGMAFEEILKVL